MSRRRGPMPGVPQLHDTIDRAALAIESAVAHGVALGMTEDRCRALLMEWLGKGHRCGWSPSYSIVKAREAITAEARA